MKPDRGDLVTAVTSTLHRLGFLANTTDRFDQDVTEAVKAFQQARGLSVSGEIDQPTEKALEEARWKLGDRTLKLQQPNMRGDDVASLQSRLIDMGFNPGRVDGIFGPIASEAVSSFQANCGLSEDGIFGPQTLLALDRVSRQTGDGPGIAALRDRDQLMRSGDSDEVLRVAIGVPKEFEHLARLIARALRKQQVRVITVLSADVHEQSLAANNFGSNVFVSVEVADGIEQSATVAHYEVPNYVSESGRELATSIASAFHRIGIGLTPSVVGYQRPVLRETKMPAVLCSFFDTKQAHDHTPALAEAIAASVWAWLNQTR